MPLPSDSSHQSHGVDLTLPTPISPAFALGMLMGAEDYVLYGPYMTIARSQALSSLRQARFQFLAAQFPRQSWSRISPRDYER